MQHEVLNFIKQKLVFLPISDKPLMGEKIGRYIAPFQERIIKTAFKPNGEPNKSLFLGWSRKWGKSMITSWVLNYLLERKEGFNALTAASTFSQSSHIFKLVADQILLNPKGFKSKYRITKERIENLDRGNSLSRIYSNASANLGQVSIKFFVYDQLESARDRANLDSITSGMMMQKSRPHIFLNLNVPESPSHWSVPYVEGKREDKNFAFFEFCADMKKNWQEDRALREANPFFDLYFRAPKKYPHLKGFVQNLKHERAISEKHASESITFRRFSLGQRISQKQYQWVRSEDLKTIPLKEVLGWDSRIVCGLDLSETTDFSACSVTFFDKKSDRIGFFPILHLGAEMDWRRRPQQRLFREWGEKGHIALQKGRKAVNPDIFLADMDDFIMKNRLRVEQFVWDRGLVSQVLVDRYPKSTLVHSTAYQLGGAVRRAEGRAKQGDLYIVGKDNPCVRWQVDCAHTSEKSKGFCLLDRMTTRESIDVCQALVLSIKWEKENPEKTYFIACG